MIWRGRRGKTGIRGARSSSGEFHSPFVGASKFLIGIMNFEDAQFVGRPAGAMNRARSHVNGRIRQGGGSYGCLCGRLDMQAEGYSVTAERIPDSKGRAGRPIFAVRVG